MDLTPDDIEEYNGLVATWNTDRDLVSGQALVDFLNEHKDPEDPEYQVVSTTILSISQPTE